MATKDKRFQLFLFGLHDKTAEQAEKNGVSLSTEVRNRVSRSYWQDEVIERLFQLVDADAVDGYDLELLKDFAHERRDKHNHEMQKREAEYADWKATQ